MHGLVFEVTIDPARGDEAEKLLHETVVPPVKALPGFVTAYWLRSDDGTRGVSVVVFESEETAQNALDNGPRPPEGAPATIIRVDRMAVLAHA